MSSINVSDKWLAVSRGNNLRIFDVSGHDPTTLELPPVPPPVKPKKVPDESTVHEEKNVILGLQFSPCGKWLACYSSSKQLVLWETSTWTSVSYRCMPKAASSLKFSPDSKAIVIGDKAGDAILFSVDDPQREGEVILGHLSMLLDVVISVDGKHIITCDRDEKIRVSQFPNAYNIVSYCLGHKEFVASLCLISHNPSVLLSSAGDGMLRLWDFLQGVALASCECSSDVNRELTVEPALLQLENEINSVIVKKVCCSRVNADSSVVCVLCHGYLGCLVYQVDNLSIKFNQALCTKEVVLDVCFKDSGELFVLLASERDVVQCFVFDQACNKFAQPGTGTSPAQSVHKINTSLNNIPYKCDLSSNMPQLLKRKYDNVRDYYEQKKARVEGLS